MRQMQNQRAAIVGTITIKVKDDGSWDQVISGGGSEKRLGPSAFGGLASPLLTRRQAGCRSKRGQENSKLSTPV